VSDLRIGYHCEKNSSNYGGPGRVVYVVKDMGKTRYVVAFKIGGDFSEFCHILNASQLRLIEPGLSA
jgi:hypothetical protein